MRGEAGDTQAPLLPAPSSLLPAFAITAPGLESVAATELTALGFLPYDHEPGGVAFDTDRRGLYRANLQLRTVSRILVRAAAFRAAHFSELERHAATVPWGTWVPAGGAVHFRITSRKSRLYHQKAIADRLEEAVRRAVPQAQAVRGAAEVEERDDVQRFVVRLAYDQCTVSADSSGALLHQRGYRLAVARAPLRETLAAAMLLGTGWDPATPLIDPMCGSGTIPIEAALLARRIPPGWRRRFAFERWADFDLATWQAVRAEAETAILPRAPVPIVASDRDAGAVAATRSNAERAGVLPDLTIHQGPLSAVEPPDGSGLLLTNPPYGLRIGEADALRDLFARLGQVMRQQLSGWRLGLLSANPALPRQLALPMEVRWRTSNGGIPVELLVGSAPADPRHGSDTPLPPAVGPPYSQG